VSKRCRTFLEPNTARRRGVVPSQDFDVTAFMSAPALINIRTQSSESVCTAWCSAVQPLPSRQSTFAPRSKELRRRSVAPSAAAASRTLFCCLRSRMPNNDVGPWLRKSCDLVIQLRILSYQGGRVIPTSIVISYMHSGVAIDLAIVAHRKPVLFGCVEGFCIHGIPYYMLRLVDKAADLVVDFRQWLALTCGYRCQFETVK